MVRGKGPIWSLCRYCAVGCVCGEVDGLGSVRLQAEKSDLERIVDVFMKVGML